MNIYDRDNVYSCSVNGDASEVTTLWRFTNMLNVILIKHDRVSALGFGGLLAIAGTARRQKPGNALALTVVVIKYSMTDLIGDIISDCV